MHTLTDSGWRHLIQRSLDMFCLANVDGYLRSLNPQWERALGWTEAELTSRPFIEFVHPDDIAPTLSQVERLKEGLAVIQFENRYRHKNGSWRWLQWNTVAMDNGDLFCSARDVTLIKEMMLLQREKLRNEKMAEELGRVGHWRVDLLNSKVYWSDEIYRIHGVPLDEDEPPLEDAINAYHPDGRAAVTAAVNDAIENRSGFQFEQRLIQRGGAIRDVISRGVCQTNDHGEPVALFGVFIDITERKQIERELERRAHALERSNHDLERFAYAASHDLKAPLRNITNLATFVLEDEMDNLDEESVTNLRHIVSVAKRMDRLVKDLLAFSQLQGLDGPPQTVALDDVVATVLSDIGGAIDERRAVVQVCERLPVVSGDPAQLRRLVQNLINNSLKFTEGPPAVRVWGEDLDATCRLYVRDNGIGFDEKYLSLIFEVFKRLHPKSAYEGSGVGLAMCKRIVEHHKGSITARSAPGEGATFIVELPRAR